MKSAGCFALLGLLTALPVTAPLSVRAASTRLPQSTPIQSAPPRAEPRSQGQSRSEAPELRNSFYLMGPGDQLELRLFDSPELSGPLEVLNDGTVSLPLIGSVKVSGLTLAQAQQWFSLLFERYLQRPQLLLRVTRPRPIRVALVGEIERPGVYSLTTQEQSETRGAPSTTLSGAPTVIDALQKAGGITLHADLTQVVLQRRLPGDLPRYKRARINLMQLVQEGDQTQNPELFDGDTIRIARAAQPAPQALEVSSTNLAPKEITVYVIGEVQNPGRLQVPAGIPLVQSVLAAGGLKAGRGQKSSIQLVRIQRNGTAVRQQFALDLSQSASNASNPPLRDGDTVIVSRTPFAVVSDGISQVSTPLTGLASILALIRLVNNSSW